MPIYKNGWTEERYRLGHIMQDGSCAICGSHTKLCMDHCHLSGEPRGLLCKKCNAGIGMLNDSPTLLINALRYLDKWHGFGRSKEY